jgi:hypothetical protein
MTYARATAFSAIMASGALIMPSTESAAQDPLVEQVKVCSLNGDGFFYRPSTGMCVRLSSGFAGGFNRTSVNNAWFMSTDTLAAIPIRTLGVDSSNTSGAIGYMSTISIPLFAPPKTTISIN